jgi:hypothetical protein
MVNRDPAKKQQSMGQYRRGKWRFTRKCSNQWVNTAHLYVSLDCRTWKVENLAFERFFLAKSCSWCIRTVTSWCRVFGSGSTRGDRFSPSRCSGKVAFLWCVGMSGARFAVFVRRSCVLPSPCHATFRSWGFTGAVTLVFPFVIKRDGMGCCECSTQWKTYKPVWTHVYGLVHWHVYFQCVYFTH